MLMVLLLTVNVGVQLCTAVLSAANVHPLCMLLCWKDYTVSVIPFDVFEGLKRAVNKSRYAMILYLHKIGTLAIPEGMNHNYLYDAQTSCTDLDTLMVRVHYIFRR